VLVELRDGKTVPELVYDSEEAELVYDSEEAELVYDSEEAELVYDSEEAELVYDGINSLVELSEDEELEGLVLLKGGI